MWIGFAMMKLVLNKEGLGPGKSVSSGAKINQFTCSNRTKLQIVSDNLTTAFNFFINWAHFDVLLLGYAIIILKSPQDILQGVNKLDYLLKVSVFQIYKDTDKENKKRLLSLKTESSRKTSSVNSVTSS